LKSLDQETQIRMSGNELRHVSVVREPLPIFEVSTFRSVLVPLALCGAIVFVISHIAPANLLLEVSLEIYAIAATASVTISSLIALLSAKAAHQFNVAIATTPIATPSVATFDIVLYNGQTG
jgi:repressor of nif and glnA expression